MVLSPDCGVHRAVVDLLVVQLGKQREENLDASYGMDGAVYGVGYDGLHVLWGTGRTRQDDISAQ